MEEVTMPEMASVLCADRGDIDSSSKWPPVIARTRPMQRAGRSAVISPARDLADRSARVHHEPKRLPTSLGERNDE